MSGISAGELVRRRCGAGRIPGSRASRSARSCRARVDPVPVRRRRRVPAGVERLRDLADLRLGVGDHQVDERALAGAARAEDERRAAGEQRRETLARLGRRRSSARARAPRRRSRRRARRSRAAGERRQVALVEDDARRDRRRSAAAISARASCDSLNTGSAATTTSSWSMLAANALVFHSSWRYSRLRARQHRLDHALVARALPAHAVADDGSLFLPRGVAEDARAVVGLDDEVPAVAGDDPAFLSRRLQPRKATRASALAAQMKSFAEMPPAEWVEKRTVQRSKRDAQVGVVVFDVADPGQRIDEGHRLEPALEGEASSRSRRRPRASRSSARGGRGPRRRSSRRRARWHCWCEEIGHGAIGSEAPATSAARRSTAGGCE